MLRVYEMMLGCLCVVAQALLIVSAGLVWRFDRARLFPVVRLCLSVFEETMSVRTLLFNKWLHFSCLAARFLPVIAPSLRAGP